MYGTCTHLLELVLALLQLEVGADLWVLERKLFDLGAVQVVQDARVDLPRELGVSVM